MPKIPNTALPPASVAAAARGFLPEMKSTSESSAGSPTFLGWKAVCARTSLSRATLYRLSEVGLFPPPVRIHGARVGWVEAEVDAWIVARIAERDRDMVAYASKAQGEAPEGGAPLT